MHRNDLTFTGSNYNNGGNFNIYGVSQYVAFDFSTFNLSLKDFAFGFRDDNPAGTTAPGYGFSLFTGVSGPTTGSTNFGFLIAYPNDKNVAQFSATEYDGGVTASITAVPEPAGLGLLSFAALATIRRRKSAL